MGVSNAIDHNQKNIKMPNPSKEPPASSKNPNQDLKDIDVFCTFKIKTESQNWEYGCTKGHLSYPNPDQDAKSQSETTSILQSSNSALREHGCSLHLQNKDRESKSRSWLYKKPVTISKSRSRCQTPVRNLQYP